MTDPNRPEPTRPFKRKNFARIYSACKGETLTDKGVPAERCEKCGVVSKKKECQFCHTKREEK